jgi:hypothetical protein
MSTSSFNEMSTSHPQVVIGDVFFYGDDDVWDYNPITIILVTGIEYSSFFDDDMIECIAFRYGDQRDVSIRKRELLKRFHKV